MTTLTRKSQASKGYKGLPMEGPIASWYADTARKDHSDQDKAARLIAERLPAGGALLEVAPGPGYLSIELARLGRYKITGLDISKSFVEIASRKAAEAGVAIDFRLGNASDMPFPDRQFDFVVCQAAFKNFSEPVQAINEFHRVLKPGGEAVIFDLRADAAPADIKQAVEDMHLSWFNHFMTQWTFDHVLLKNAYTRADFQSMATHSAFKTCHIDIDTIGLAVWFKRAV